MTYTATTSGRDIYEFRSAEGYLIAELRVDAGWNGPTAPLPAGGSLWMDGPPSDVVIEIREGG
jgi:hypothetical protein